MKDKIQEQLEKGCGEDMVNFKCGELQPNYFNQKKHEVMFCLVCKAKLQQHKETKAKILKEFEKKIDEQIRFYKMDLKEFPDFQMKINAMCELKASLNN